MTKNRGCLSILLGPLLPSDNTENHTVRYTEPDEPVVEEMPYHLRDDFLSKAELSFFQVLKTMMKDYLVICPQVSLAELFFVDHQRENYGAFGRIRQKRVDFLLCEPATMRPKFAIELDDHSHDRSDRQERDEFVDRVFMAAGLPLVHVPAQAEYNTRELGEIFRSILQPPAPTQKTLNLPQKDGATTPVKVNYCPRCGAKMMIRVAQHGANKGKKFLGCENYPKCQFIAPFIE